MLTSATRRKCERMFFVLCFLLANVIRVNALSDDNARAIKHHDYPGMEHYENNPTRPTERSIFTYRRAGVRVDVKIVSTPGKNSTSESRKIVERFPEFPTKDIGRCVLDLSLICLKKRFTKLLESIGRLDEITLIGQDVKLVKTRIPKFERRSISDNDIDSDDIERSIDDFFDTFVLRITLPRWNGKREKNQIDVMFDESGPTEVFEGRGKIGGGGGGLGGNKGGGGGGGKCKMMMMAMLMLAKMKIIGVIGMMAMKGMVMGAMSLMISTVMLMMKYLKGGGPWPSGGGGGGGGSQIKEVVLLAKIPNGGGGGGGGYGGGGGGGGSYGGGGGSYGGGGNGGYGGGGNGGYGNGGCCNGGDSYSPPSTSYGVPSGGGGGGYGGGWGRSFTSGVLPNNESKNRIKIPLMIGESIDNRDSPSYEDYQDLNANLTSPRIDSKAFNYTALPNYGNINGSINANSTELLNSTSVNANGKIGRAESVYNLNVLRPVYMNEWQAAKNANALNEKANKEG